MASCSDDFPPPLAFALGVDKEIIWVYTYCFYKFELPDVFVGRRNLLTYMGESTRDSHEYKHQPDTCIACSVSQSEGESKRLPRCPAELVKCFVTEASSFSISRVEIQKRDLQKTMGLVHKSRKLPQYESRISFTI